MTKLLRIIKETNTAAIGSGIRGLGNVTGEPAIGDEHVSGYIADNEAYTEKLKGNITDGLYGLGDSREDEWSMSQKEAETMKKIFHRGTKSFKQLREEIANSVGSGAIPGVGVNPPDKPANWGEPGVSKKKQKEIQDNQTSVVMRRNAIFEERRNNISTGDKMPEDTHFDDFISDFGRKPDITYDAGDGKHLIHIFNEKHPDIPGATERTTLFTDRKTGHVNAHIESRVLQSEHNPDEELHSNLFTRGREGGPKGFVAHAYYMLMNGKSGKYAIFNHGGVYANSNGNIKLTNSSRSEGAHAMSLHMRKKFPGIVYNIHDPKTGISREAGEGGYVSTKNMSGPLADYAERQIPQTFMHPDARDPLPETPLWVNKK